MSGPPPLRFYSVVLAVADLPRMRDWYGGILGFETCLSGVSEADGTAFAVMEGAGTRVELVARQEAMVRPPPDPPEHLGVTGWRVLDLECDDLLALDGYLRACGVTISCSMRHLSPRRAMTLIRDPEGNLIALFGPPPGV